MNRPPLGLTVNVKDASGASTRWASNARSPEDHPRNINFASQRMQGFSTASLDLSRRIDRDYVDLHLYDDVQIVGDDGSIAWEGRIGSNPRSADMSHVMSIQCAGWMAAAKDRKFTQIMVDRDLGQWHGPGTARRTNLLGGMFGSVTDPANTQDAGGRQAVRTALKGPWTAGNFPICEAWYDAGPGNKLGLLTASWTKGPNTNAADVNWTWLIALSDDDLLSASDSTPTLRAVGPGAATLSATTNTRRYGVIQFYYGVGAGADADREYSIDWDTVAAYGQYVPLVNAAAPYGVTASDAIKFLVNLYCPLLKTSGVQSTTYPIPHLVFREPTDPYDSFLDVNKYHLWDLSVWENKTLYYAPTDLRDYDWEIRLGDPGTSTSLQGDTTEDLANGIAVTYQNVATGIQDRLTPDAYADLKDLSVENPANRNGLTVWTEYQISVPTTQDAALQLGRAALAEFNAPKSPGTITAGPYVRDRQGNSQQAWKVRSGDRVAITSSSSLSDRPRLIHDASYTHGPSGVGQVSMSIDSTAKTLPAVLDRITTALSAANLT